MNRVPGAIGYSEYSFPRQANIPDALVQSQAGKFISSSMDSFLAAINGVDWAGGPDFDSLVTNTTAPNAYPITATSFAVVNAYPRNADRVFVELRAFAGAICATGGSELGQETAMNGSGP